MLNFATIDFETYYDKDYTLSKLSTDEYILDTRFEIIGVGVRTSVDAEIEWFSGTEQEVKRFLQSAIDWPNTIVCAHNTMFDGFICTQKLGLKPKMWLDTLGMARALFPWLPSHSLAAIAEFLGVGHKGMEVQMVQGKRRADFNVVSIARYGEYCKNDVALTALIATLLLERFPPLELSIIDMCIRMFTEPRLLGDAEALRKYYNAEVARKEGLLMQASVDRGLLMSNDKFAAALATLGVLPPMKTSLRTAKPTYAFAKTDKAFTALLEHENPAVQALVAARLGVKTTITETRAERFANAALRGPLPVYLNYWGAKTTGRLSGGNKMNWQNVPARGAGSELRTAIIAPPGHSIVVGDSSNIELRVAMASAGQTDVLEKITAGADLYCDFATKLFGRVITKNDKKERMLGKVAMLSLQYGAGAIKFMEMVRIQVGMLLSESEATKIVQLWREIHKKVVQLWYYCGNEVLPAIQQDRYLVPVDVNGWFLTNEVGFSQPGYPGVCYHELKKTPEGDWTYNSGREWVKIYGGKVVENLCQHAARAIVMWQTARVHQRFPVSLSVHDEIVCVVRDEEVEACRAYMQESLSLAPAWCRGAIPLACEIGVGKSYGAAK